MTKICFIIDNLKIAGAQKHLLRLVKGLAEKGCFAEIICLGNRNEEIVTDINTKIHYLKMNCIWKPHFWLSFLNLIRILVKENPDIVHTYLNTSNVFGVLAAKIAHVPIIISSRRDLGQFRSGIIGLLESLTARLSDRVVCVSEAVQRKVSELDGVSKDKLAVIPNGVNFIKFVHRPSSLVLREQLGILESDLVVGIIATMDREEKGHREFIEAANLVLKELLNIKFLLIGEGPLEKSLQLSVISHQLQDKVKFLGKRNDILELFSMMDVSVNASYSEGMSNTILESMAAGVPVIATAVDGNLEIVKSLKCDYTPACRQAGITKSYYTDENYATGILVPVKEPKAMAKAIIKILNDKELAKQMGQNAIKLVEEKFSLEKMVQNYAELYEGLISSKKSRQFAFDSRKFALNKVGYIVSLFPCWSETFILDEIIALTNKGIDIDIFSIRRDLEKFTQEKAKPFLKQVKYPHFLGIITSTLFWLIRKPLTFLSLFRLALRKKYPNQRILLRNIWCILAGAYFGKIALKNKISHLHAHFATYPAFTALVISKLTKISYTFTCHAHDIFLDKTFLKEVVEGAKDVVAISEYNRRYVADYCGNGMVNKIKVIHCGVNLSDFQPIIKGEGNYRKTIVSIGRLTEMKGFEYLIKALSKIKNQLAFECHIIGDGPLKNSLYKLIEDLGMQRQIFLEGVRDSDYVKTILNKADLFVQSSVWSDKDGQDGIPVALMEAMASGVPVIASNISGIPELVIDRNTGLLVETSNVEELAEKILELLTDKELCLRLAEDGRRKIETEFNVDKNVGKLVKLFGY